VAALAGGGRVDGFREALRAFVAELGALLDAGQAPSDAWFEFGKRLSAECRRLGSATYCLFDPLTHHPVLHQAQQRCLARTPGSTNSDRERRGRFFPVDEAGQSVGNVAIAKPVRSVVVYRGVGQRPEREPSGRRSTSRR